VIIEGLALAAFALIRDFSEEPLSKAINTYVMQDEARHVAFGRLALRDFYPQLTQAELRHPVGPATHFVASRGDQVVQQAIDFVRVLPRGPRLIQQLVERIGHGASCREHSLPTCPASPATSAANRENINGEDPSTIVDQILPAAGKGALSGRRWP
jgi:hypothetical protein